LYADPLVLLPRSGYLYLKCERAPMGCYILRSSAQICEILEKSKPHDSHFFCAQLLHMAILHVNLRDGTFLVVQQLAVHGMKMRTAIVKLQWWFRRLSRHYSVLRRATVAMCLHERLGEASKLGCIGADIIKLIAFAL
jgi:hypothetical protein